MTPEQVVEALKGMSEKDVQKVAELATRMFSQKAEDIYDEDPENNGRPAQHWADIAMLTEQIALVGEEVEDDNPVDDPELEQEAPRPTTVSQAVSASTKDPWGGR